MILLLIFLQGVAFAAGIKLVPSAATVANDDILSVDVIVENISAQGLGTVQFRLNVSATGSTVTGLTDISQAKSSEISVATPLLISPYTSTRSGIGDFFWNAAGPHGILVIDNETLQNGSGMYSLSQTNGASLPAGSGTIARFLIKPGTGISSDKVTLSLSEVALLNGDEMYTVDYATGAEVEVRCRNKMPSLLGLSYSEALNALSPVHVSAGTVYEIDNSSGTLPLNVVLEQSIAAGSDVFCGSMVDLAINTGPTIEVSNVFEGGVYTANITPQITITDTNLRGSTLTLNGQTYIQGTPIKTNNQYTLAIAADDVLGNTTSLTLHFTLDKPPVAIGTVLLTPATVGSSYVQTLSASGGTAPYDWTVSGGSLPPGLSLNNGQISGVPTTVGMYSVTLQAADADLSNGTKTFAMNVNDISIQWVGSSGKSDKSRGTGIAVDEEGNVLVAGYTWNGTDNDYLTIKYDQTGSVLWTRSYDSGADDYAAAVTADGAGNVAVTGYSGSGTANSYLTIKYDSSGNIVSTLTYNNGTDSRAAGVAADATGNLSVAGTTCSGAGCDITTIGYDAAGALVRIQQYNGGHQDGARGVAIDAAGNTYVTGYSSNGVNADYILIKIDPSGLLSWTRSYDSGLDDYAAGVAADGSGNVYVAGYSGNGTTNAYLLVKYDSAGTVVWTRTYESGFNDAASGVALDRDGNAYIVGSSSIDGGSDYQIVKYDSSGNIVWTQRYDNGTKEYAAGIAVDGIGSVAVTGYTVGDTGNEDFLTVKYHKVGQGMAVTTESLPVAELNTAYSRKLIALGGTPPYTWSIISGELPGGMSVNTSTGEISGTALVNANVSFTVMVTDSAGATAEKTFTMIAHDAPLVTTDALASAVTGIAYNQVLSASGGSGSYVSWQVVSGELPSGLALSAGAGVISGTPSATGTFTFTIEVKDSDGLSSTKQFSIVVSTLRIATTQLGTGLVGFSYSQTLTATGGAAPYTWSISEGSLAPGLTLDGTAGTISGKPTASGTYSVSIQAADQNGATATQDYSVIVNDPLGAYIMGGSYIASQKVMFKPAEGIAIYCTVDGTDPVISSASLCTGPVLISRSLTFKFFAVDSEGNRGDQQPETYTISGGQVLSWGQNTSGQLGDGTANDQVAPVQATAFTDVVAIAGGADHSAALGRDGLVRAWGGNSSGQLGDGTTNSSLSPVQVSGLTDVNAVAAGVSHTVAVRKDGTVWSWGNNDFGKLGDGTTTAETVPVQVNGLANAVDIAAGNQHTVVVKNDGTVWSWGHNAYGQLGDGTTNSSPSPVQVSGLNGVVALSAQGDHTVALKNDGTVWAWGSIGSGQLGDGTVPVQVAGFADIIAVATGDAHIIGLKKDGTVWTWGNNDYGQLGEGTTTSNFTAVQVTELTSVAAVASGSAYSAAVKSDGTIWSWGKNDHGQLGNGITDGLPSLVPVQATGINTAAAASAGVNHTLAIQPAPLTIATTSLANGTISYSYTQTLAGSGGLLPYVWTISSGSLPAGLNLDSGTGVISGTPTATGTSSFTVQLMDENATVTEKVLSIAISVQLNITTSSLSSGTTGTTYNQTLTATGGTTPYAWSISSGSLPSGLALNSATGVISGTPTATGTSNFAVQVSDAAAGTATKSLSLVIVSLPDLVVTSVSGPISGVTGSTITVSHTVKNQGTSTAGSFSVAVFLSADSTITTSDTSLGGRAISSLAAGAESPAGLQVTIPTSLAPGTYYIGVIVDYGSGNGSVAESDETNNALAGNQIIIASP
jgi:alpha-tubulin suppressor-like RCC1 family protein